MMKVKELMSTDVKTIREDADLSTATKLMWDGDCGIVPVINDDRQVIGSWRRMPTFLPRYWQLRIAATMTRSMARSSRGRRTFRQIRCR